MSASQTVVDNFSRIHDKATILHRAALELKKSLFGPEPESANKDSSLSGSAPSGFFPLTFSWQEQIERELYETAEVISSLNKVLTGEAESKTPKTLRPMPKATLAPGETLSDHLAKHLGETL